MYVYLSRDVNMYILTDLKNDRGSVLFRGFPADSPRKICGLDFSLDWIANFFERVEII